MGEGTTRVVETNGAGARVRELGEEITHVRNGLDALVVELDRRRHLVTNLKRQLRRHAGTIAVGAVVVAALAVTPIVLSRRRAVRQRALARHGADLSGKARRLGQALGRIAHDPDRLAPPQPRTLGPSTFVAIALTVGQILAQRLLAGAGARRP
jgi:hypothetical protein